MTARAPQPRDGVPKVAVAAAAAGLLSLVGLGALTLRRRPEPHAEERGGYEPRDAPPKLVVAAIAGCLSLVGIGALVAWGMTAAHQGGHPTQPATGFDLAAAVPAEPRLEVDQTADRVRLERQAQAHLTGYGWTNQAAGLARIPIDRAMALQAAEGWPDAAINAAAPTPVNAAPPTATNTTAATNIAEGQP